MRKKSARLDSSFDQVVCFLCELYIKDQGKRLDLANSSEVKSAVDSERMQWTSLTREYDDLSESIAAKRMEIMDISGAHASLNFEMYRLFKENSVEMIRLLARISSKNLRGKITSAELNRIDSMAKKYLVHG